MKRNRNFSIVFLLIMLGFVSCTKFVEVGTPKTEVVASEIFSKDALATNALLSIYGQMMGNKTFCSVKTTVNAGQSADELISYSTPVNATYYTNSLLSNTDDFWTAGYNYIYQANAVIDGLATYSGVNPTLKQQLTGEALFIRAFCHFYLVNLFGDVPYITSIDYKTNNLASRMPSATVYQKIIEDLIQSQNMLTNNFLSASNAVGIERVRANKAVATALLARTYLYAQKWSDAEAQATSIINNTATYSLVADLTKVFLKNSTETIWQLQPATTTYTNTYEAPSLVITATPSAISNVTVSLSDRVWNAFEPNDKRKISWIGTFNTYHYAYKYKVSSIGVVTNGGAVISPPPATTEYYMVLRLAEQFLIRAEARAQLGELAGAVADLNVIRTRAGLPSLSETLSKEQILIAVAHERQVELFVEWGHRWLDLKRTGQANAVLGPIKGANWQSTDQLYPLPLSQITLGPNTANAQNPGYD